METNNQTLDQKEIQFLWQIKNDLCLQNAHDAVKLVASVLQSLRQTLTLQSANVLLNKLPDFLQLVFVTNWKRHERQVPVKHLDELVSLVMKRDKKNLFKNEIQTLSAVIVTLKKLFKLIEVENIDGISPSLHQELRNIPTEVAA